MINVEEPDDERWSPEEMKSRLQQLLQDSRALSGKSADVSANEVDLQSLMKISRDLVARSQAREREINGRQDGPTA
jgi:hypothetical protein